MFLTPFSCKWRITFLEEFPHSNQILVFDGKKYFFRKSKSVRVNFRSFFVSILTFVIVTLAVFGKKLLRDEGLSSGLLKAMIFFGTTQDRSP